MRLPMRHTLNIRLTDPLFNCIEAEAARHGMKMAEFVRMTLEQQLDLRPYIHSRPKEQLDLFTETELR